MWKWGRSGPRSGTLGATWGDGGRLLSWSGHERPVGPEGGVSGSHEAEVRWLCVSLSEDPSGREVSAVAMLAAKERPLGVLLDAPVNYAPGRLAAALRKGGYVPLGAPEQVVCTHFGDVTARTRSIQLWADGRRATPPSEGLGPIGQPCTEPRGVCQLWREAGCPAVVPLPPESGTLQVDPRISTTGDRMLPWPCGTWTPEGLGRAGRMVVHDPRGPCCTARAKADPVRGYTNTLVADIAGQG